MTTSPNHAAPRRPGSGGAPTGFEPHPGRGRFNAAFFWAMGGYLDWQMRKHTGRVFADLPPRVVELGPGVGANLRYLPAGAHLTAIEPNPYMHQRLQRAARRAGVALEIRSVDGERIDLPDGHLAGVIEAAGFAQVDIRPYRLRSPFLSFNPQIAGTAGV